MEQLRAEAESNRAFREGELEKAAALIGEFLEEFRHAWQLRQVEKQFLHIPAEVRRLRQRAVDEVFGQEIAAMGQQERETLHKVLDYLEHKFASLPISQARELMSESLKGQGLTRGSRTPLRRVAR
jgi:glutamyl-tRNA reductase